MCFSHFIAFISVLVVVILVLQHKPNKNWKIYTSKIKFKFCNILLNFYFISIYIKCRLVFLALVNDNNTGLGEVWFYYHYYT